MGYTIPPSLIPYLTGERKDYSSRQASVITVNVVIIVVSCVMSALRFWVRIFVLRSPGLDDALLLVSLTFLILSSTSCMLGETFGLGKHVWNLAADLTKIPAVSGEITKTLFGAYLAYSTAITFAKLSIIAMYLRIFPLGGVRNVLYTIAGIMVSFWICSIFTIIFQCNPVHAAWDYATEGTCIEIVTFFYVAASINIATDVVLCVMPIPTLWALSMPKSQRVVLCLIFSMGTFGCVASILRAAQLHELNGVDVSYGTVTSLNWSTIEVGAAIICTSASALRPLGARLFPSFFNTSHFTSGTPPFSFGSQLVDRKASAPVSRSPVNRLQKWTAKDAKATPSPSAEGQNGIEVRQTFDIYEMKVLPEPPISPISPLEPIKQRQEMQGRNEPYLETKWRESSSKEELVESV